MKKLAPFWLLLPLVASWPAAAQTWDTSGNGQLNGTYYFREVAWLVGDNSGNLSEAASVYGTLTFDGNGNWTINSANLMDSGNNGPQTFTAKGTYSIAANGYGSMSSLISMGDSVYGLVSKGVFVASSTENGNYNDLFIAAQLPATTPTNSTFQGSYSLISADFPDPFQDPNGIFYTRSTSFQLNPDGNGNLNNVQVTGFIAGNGTKGTTQNVGSIKYRTSNGAVVLAFGGQYTASNSKLISGDEYLYFSPDTNFVFGGSPNGWDMIVGVKNGGSAPKFGGLYYEAGVSQDNSQLASSGAANLSTGYGAVNSISGYLLAHQRILSVFNNNPIDYTYADSATANSDGSFDDSYNHYVLGGGGAYAIGLAKGTSMGIEALVQAPTFSGSGVYIDPSRVQNAGSNVPFTAQWAPGELISIYGKNLASTTALDYTLPTKLGGVTVMVNNQPAPIVFVSPTQINAVVPITITAPSVASVQVINSIGSSNIVTNYVGMTQPGIFNSTSTPAVTHANNTLVTSSNPAKVGETVQVYLTGLGSLNSSGNSTNTFTAYVDGIQASVAFAGSQSTVGGGYQMNVVVPTGIHSGPVYLDISGPDAYNSEAGINIAAGSGTVSSIRTAPQLRRLQMASANPKARRRHILNLQK